MHRHDILKHLRHGDRLKFRAGTTQFFQCRLRRLMPKASKIELPKRVKNAKMMKGRPVTGEEFERMLAKLPTVLTETPKLPPMSYGMPTNGPEVTLWVTVPRVGLYLVVTVAKKRSLTATG